MEDIQVTNQVQVGVVSIWYHDRMDESEKGLVSEKLYLMSHKENFVVWPRKNMNPRRSPKTPLRLIFDEDTQWCLKGAQTVNPMERWK